MKAKHEPIIGKYMYVTVQGIEYRVYYEEAGQGIPIVLGHTAGSDGREWHWMLNDEEITKNFRLIAFDLPYHGKSLPPFGKKWWEEKYSADSQYMMDWPNAIAEALELENPIYMGMSMGGHLAIDLALFYPDNWSATIGIEGALRTNDEYASAVDGNGMEQVDWEFDNPMISRNALGAAMLLNMAPQSPEECVKECMWTYMQGGPGVFAGDLVYYNGTAEGSHNLTVDQVRQIDVNKCMLYLLTGEYDPNTSPADTIKVAENVEGCYFRPMEALGHFGAIENYPKFKEYLMPVLDDILAKAN